MNDFLIIEACNFIDCPVGGQLSFAKQLIEVYGDNVGLVGVTASESVPIGVWTKIRINEKDMDFFAFRRVICKANKPLFPERISSYLAIRKYKKQILSRNKNAFTQAPELLIAIQNWGWSSLCYEFPGVENPLIKPRYKWGVLFANIYEYQLFKALKKADVILASAGKTAIENLIKRSKGMINPVRITQFPTRVDNNFFRVIHDPFLIPNYNVDSNKILVVCGRINEVKGWDLILESFKLLIDEKNNLQLYFVGDGEDKIKLENFVITNNLKEYVHVTGFQSTQDVLKWLNLANLVLVGSHNEGWSISMLESLACGKPIISTNVSGAKEMIVEGKNGYIIDSRNPRDFAAAILAGLKLDNPNSLSVQIAEKYSITTLKEELNRLWPRQ